MIVPVLLGTLTNPFCFLYSSGYFILLHFFFFQVDQEFKNVKKNIKATNENLTKLTSSVKDLKLKVNDQYI